MKTYVLLDTSYPINNRNQKIIDSLKKWDSSIIVNVITWDREHKCENPPSNYYLYDKIAKYGNHLQKFLRLKGYKDFIKRKLNQLKPDVIIASHWDTLILVPQLDRKSQKLIYENLDIPTGSFFIRNLIKCFEWRALKNVDLILHASRFYVDLYSQKVPQIILENKPNFVNLDMPNYKPNRSIRVSYIGTIRYFEVLINLIDAIRDNTNLELTFFGSGPDYDKCVSYAKNMSNVKFYGAYSYGDIKKFYSQTDILWAAYPNKDFNVKYAISNKFHESLCLAIPCIYSDKTCLGEYVSRNKIGLIVNPYSVESIKNLFQFISEKNLYDIHENLLKYKLGVSSWEADFKQLELFLSKKHIEYKNGIDYNAVL